MATRIDSAAPSGVRQLPASLSIVDNDVNISNLRRRRRGPRSFRAKLRRALPRRCRALPGAAPGESGASAPEINSALSPQSNLISDASFDLPSSHIIRHDSFPRRRQRQEILIFVLNIQSLRSRVAELEFPLSQLQPHLVLLQETWLDASVEQIAITGYYVVSRRDRSTDSNRGGILTLARADFNHIAQIANSKTEERSWHYLNLEPENILIGNWYRPGATEHDGFEALQNEIVEFSSECTGIILTGDLNIHHAKWLRFSNGNSLQGSDLKMLCDNYGLHQLTMEPTRQQYLLDLFLTDVPGTKAKVGAYVADHKFLCTSVLVPEVKAKTISRYGFHIKRAKWSQLESALDNVDWSPLQRGTSEDALQFFMETLWLLLCIFIPYTEIKIEKRSHPWLNERCSQAILEKNQAENTEAFDAKRKACSQILSEEYKRHVTTLKEKIANLKKGSKQWWRLNRELLDKKNKLSSIPPLRDGSTWIDDSKSKANLLAQKFDAKAKLPNEEVDCPFFRTSRT